MLLLMHNSIQEQNLNTRNASGKLLLAVKLDEWNCHIYCQSSNGAIAIRMRLKYP